MARPFWVLALMALPLVAAAQVYRWVDDKGRVHYSQVPPVGRDSRPVGPAPPPSAAPNQESLNQSLSEFVKAEPKRQEEAAKTAEAQARKQQQCQQARDQIAFMDARPPRSLGTIDENGTPSRMTDDQLRAQRAELESRVAANCS